jgi:hypothetical protein
LQVDEISEDDGRPPVAGGCDCPYSDRGGLRPGGFSSEVAEEGLFLT